MMFLFFRKPGHSPKTSNPSARRFILFLENILGLLGKLTALKSFSSLMYMSSELSFLSSFNKKNISFLIKSPPMQPTDKLQIANKTRKGSRITEETLYSCSFYISFPIRQISAVFEKLTFSVDYRIFQRSIFLLSSFPSANFNSQVINGCAEPPSEIIPEAAVLIFSVGTFNTFQIF